MPHGPLLKVDDLHVEFRGTRGLAKAVNGISYELHPGDTLALLGESGSGKTVSALAILGLIQSPPGFVTRGAIRYRDVDLLKLDAKRRRRVAGDKIAMIFQDPLSALNPVFTVGAQIGETFRVHRGVSRAQARKHAVELMERVGIPLAPRRVDDYPHQFSGGMRQRVMIAMALALEPEILIADEPTTALDVTVQAQIIKLLATLQNETGMALILITHDLGVVAQIAERVAVMYAGRIVESGPIGAVYDAPAHPYTEGLMRSRLQAELKGKPLRPISGSPPNLVRIPSGCSFHPRCAYARERCTRDLPPLYEVDSVRRSACHYYSEVLGGG